MSKPTPLDDDQIASIKKYHAMGYPLRKLRKDYSISFARLKKIVFGEYVTRQDLISMLQTALTSDRYRIGEYQLRYFGTPDGKYCVDKVVIPGSGFMSTVSTGTFDQCLVFLKKQREAQ